MSKQRNYSSENNYNHVLEGLQDYMLTNKNMISSMSFKNSSLSNSKVEKETPKTCLNKKINVMKSVSNEPYVFYPRQTDSLFWIIYIMKNGLENYESLENTNIVTEKKMKIEYVEMLRKKKTSIKGYKIAPLSYIENNLVNEKKIDLKTFLALCIIEELNIIYTNRKTYYEFNKFIDDDEQDDGVDMNNKKEQQVNVVIRNDENGDIKYGYYVNVTDTKIKEYREKYYKMENIDKPIKVFSSYKLEDLMELCNKLSIDTINPLTNKKKTKKELYEAVVQYF